MTVSMTMSIDIIIAWGTSILTLEVLISNITLTVTVPTVIIFIIKWWLMMQDKEIIKI